MRNPNFWLMSQPHSSHTLPAQWDQAFILQTEAMYAISRKLFVRREGGHPSCIFVFPDGCSVDSTGQLADTQTHCRRPAGPQGSLWRARRGSTFDFSLHLGCRPGTRQANWPRWPQEEVQVPGIAVVGFSVQCQECEQGNRKWPEHGRSGDLCTSSAAWLGDCSQL